ncbi:hypothetical protein [Microbacterium lacticum]
MEDHTTRPRPTWAASTVIDGWATPQPPIPTLVLDCTPADPVKRAELREIIAQHQKKR